MADSAETLHSCPKCMHVFRHPDVVPPLSPTDSTIRTLLETNDPPLESQISVLRDYLSKKRARLAALDVRIELLQSSLNRLFDEKDELDAEILMHEGGLSLIRRMPTEIMSLIFAFTLPPHQPNTASAPWTVSAVCARWRNITISQPCFWTFISYDLSFPICIEGLKYETQLSRSGQSLLDIEFIVDELNEWASDDEEILQIICKHVERWEIVSLYGPVELYQQLRHSIQHRLAHLRKLTIEM
ncbi:hypothetical protein K438DRAFT_407872 [Mycena galopus ATCC 62051]|nr:hypothetical protein K438DRAFT_407872 [Mycena galopus ATCC 62051]